MAPPKKTEQFKPDVIEGVEIEWRLKGSRVGEDGRYNLKHKIGEGGYSVVYLAEDRMDKRKRVVVKCVLYDTPKRRKSFAREVALHKAASDVPGVVPVLDVVIAEENNLAFIVQTYIPGKDLFDVMIEQRFFHGRDEVIRKTFLQLLDTVEELHDRNIFHRDLKPENILCDVTPEDGFRVYITDFGLATDNEESSRFGVGSYYYMVPECLVGCQSSLLKSFSSRAADIWALGIILINLLTAKNPWKCALPSDPSFDRYSRDPRYLEHIFPFSRKTSVLLDRIFFRHGCDVKLSDIRTRILAIPTFYMTQEQIFNAPKNVRLIAAEWMHDVPTHDFTDEDMSSITLIDNITDVMLFDDEKVQAPESKESSPTTSASSEESADNSAQCTRSGRSTPPELVRGGSSGSDGTNIITPETQAIRPAEEVPDLPEEQDISDALVSSSKVMKNLSKAFGVAGIIRIKTARARAVN